MFKPTLYLSDAGKVDLPETETLTDAHAACVSYAEKRGLKLRETRGAPGELLRLVISGQRNLMFPVQKVK